jgi:hypothetical protein
MAFRERGKGRGGGGRRPKTGLGYLQGRWQVVTIFGYLQVKLKRKAGKDDKRRLILEKNARKKERLLTKVPTRASFLYLCVSLLYLCVYVYVCMCVRVYF